MRGPPVAVNAVWTPWSGGYNPAVPRGSEVDQPPRPTVAGVSVVETAAAVGSRGVTARIRHGQITIPPPLFILVAVAIVAAGQLTEDLIDSQPMQMLPPVFLARRWAIVVLVLYMLVIARVVDRTVQGALPSLERVLLVDAPRFRWYVARMRPGDVRLNAALLAISAAIVLVLFPVLGLDLPVTNDPVTNQPVFLPSSLPETIVILAGYTVVGWAGLSLLYLTDRVGRALGRLTREPLKVDVFDTTNLQPIGNIALAGSLAPAGVIVIMLLGLGRPTTWLSWTILLIAAIASVLALLLPLRGIHRQMSEAKEGVLAQLSARIGRVYQEVSQAPIGTAEPAGTGERAGTLIALRKTVSEMTTWPFADTVAFGRAVLIASAPLIYTVLSELIRIFWIEPLSH